MRTTKCRRPPARAASNPESATHKARNLKTNSLTITTLEEDIMTSVQRRLIEANKRHKQNPPEITDVRRQESEKTGRGRGRSSLKGCKGMGKGSVVYRSLFKPSKNARQWRFGRHWTESVVVHLWFFCLRLDDDDGSEFVRGNWGGSCETVQRSLVRQQCVEQILYVYVKGARGCVCTCVRACPYSPE